MAHGAPRATLSPRPNVVVILVDDAMYKEMAYLPKLQALMASQGTSFPNYFDSTSVCAQHVPGSSPVSTTQQPRSQQQRAAKFDHRNTLATWLHAAGYSTALIGKYLNGFACSNAIPRLGRLGAGLQEHQ